MEGSAKEGQPKYWILEDVLLHLNVRELSGTQTDADRQTDRHLQQHYHMT